MKEQKSELTSTIVMATYNGEKYIVKQLDSLRFQSKSPDEVIICDDCSTDNTCAIISKYISENNLSCWKLIINKHNKGYYENFLNGIRMATGDIIYLSDQDDIWDLDKIRTFKKIYEDDEEIMMIQSNYSFIDADDEEIKSDHNYHGIHNRSGKIEIPTKNMCNSPGSGFTMSFRRIIMSTIVTNKFYKHKWVFSFHDILIGLTSAALGKCILCTDIIDYHRLHSKNATQRAGQMCVVGRTRKDQIVILKRRIEEFKIIGIVCSNSEKKLLFNEFKRFNELRLDLVGKRKFQTIPKLIKMKSFYASRLGIVTDIMYAMGLEKLQMLLYRLISR